MKNTPLKICNETIFPGESLSLALPLPELFSCAPMYMPIKIVHGKQKGPCLLVIAAMYGNELNGTEIINRLLNQTILKKLKGTLIAVPVFNVYGFINKTATLPGGIFIDRIFPGTEHGSHAARFAYIFTQQILSLADYCINLQTGLLNHSNVPQVFINQKKEREKELAEIFAAPVIANVSTAEGSLRQTAENKKIPYLVFEAGEAMRFDEHAIKVGLQGILNSLRYLEMIPSTSTKSKKPARYFIVEGNYVVRSPTSGISYSKIKLGQSVKEGNLLSVIRDPFGAGPEEEMFAPLDGIVVSKNNLPLVHEGEILYELAVFPEMQKAATHLQDWKLKSSREVNGN